MPFKFDYLDGDVLEWSLTPNGVEVNRNSSYEPTIYISAHGNGDLEEISGVLRRHPKVTPVHLVEERTGFRHDPEPVLRIDVVDLDAVTDVAHEVRGWGTPGEYRCYNVDLSREFRYCLEEDVSPIPNGDLSVLDVSIPEPQLASGQITTVELDDEVLSGTREDVLEAVSSRLSTDDPDVLLLNTSEVIPKLYEQAERVGNGEFELGRLSGWQQLAGESTYASYGKVGHSPARYNLPGRVIIDRSNTFMWNQTNLDGCLDLVERSGKPIQELAWSSIGNILTAIQIREARKRGVLVPWNSWRHEQFKTMRQLHEADRGGFTFAPKVGLHKDVHELDFSSLYPNIIVTRNVSPEKIRCECHEGREDVPGLGYCICDERGYLPEVLEPLIEDRDVIKSELRETDDPERENVLEGRSNAIKWILVSCFGYQGFSNAKFGRIECHEAINAFAREILLDSKQVFEQNGWEIVHGIVDSIWVRRIEDEEQTSLNELAEQISQEVGIRLEYEAAYDWIAFVPMRDSDAGALTKYFGKVANEDEYKYRGIECRQRSTPAFIDEAQKDLIRVLDEHRDPERVCDRLKLWVERLRSGGVESEDLLIDNRVSKHVDEYSQYTRNVAALERAEGHGLSRGPGESVSYVVIDDEKRSRDRVALAHEDISDYDVDFYETLLLRAAESVLSPLGWRRSAIENALSESQDSKLSAFESWG
ncbi:type B DNA-directed DNA polymerase [Haloprofundus sp. MHR1]|uniref:type B DNA-directed DNA polymerase n=1 Tax=Haloprofundus sp. MHR1 TaxID=2572921 RepID=UPI0010BEF90F|nr:type B DNA-directed DNA polymerase [Haloprofundus sp. MHR1]QCJ47232.1 type B DNA-directed DNA polymerase [Haloprofundus sp. MHR1]